MNVMPKVIGIDIGGSTTKIVGFDNGKIFSPFHVKASDPIASIYGAFGKFIAENELAISDIEKVAITGVGSSFITGNIYGIPTEKVSEFKAIGKGGLFLSGLSKAIIVSMGTGTAYVLADEKNIRHIGGSGVGGGTLLGLSNKMLNVRDFDDLIETARGGDLSNIDLTIGDITRDVVEGLPPDSTASNFGKISDLASKSDIAMGIINLVFQTIGMLAVFAASMYCSEEESCGSAVGPSGINKCTRDIVLTGNLTNVPQSREIFRRLGELFDVNFNIPENAEYATAVGAAIM